MRFKNIVFLAPLSLLANLPLLSSSSDSQDNWSNIKAVYLYSDDYRYPGEIGDTVEAIFDFEMAPRQETNEDAAITKLTEEQQRPHVSVGKVQNSFTRHVKCNRPQKPENTYWGFPLAPQHNDSGVAIVMGTERSFWLESPSPDERSSSIPENAIRVRKSLSGFLFTPDKDDDLERRLDEELSNLVKKLESKKSNYESDGFDTSAIFDMEP